jgi:hypothetical protein
MSLAGRDRPNDYRPIPCPCVTITSCTSCLIDHRLRLINCSIIELIQKIGGASGGVSIDVHVPKCRGWLGVTQHSTNLHKGHLSADKSGRMRVPKVVEPEIRQSSLSLCLIE